VKGRVLLVDDDLSMCEMLDESLARRGFVTAWRTSAQEAFHLLETEDFDVIVTDLNMRGTNGIDLCGRIVANRPDVPVMVLTAFGSLETAVAAMRAGAYDFITKPVEIDALALALERAIQHRALREEVKRLREVVNASRHFGEIIGASPPMRRLYDLIERASETDASVLLIGESGTGKELVAQALHQRGRRREGPFVAVNCAALPENLLESELFGHARGAFTDAKASRSGLFVHASGDPHALVTPVTQIIRGMSAEQPVERAETLADVRADVLAPERLKAFVFSGFAGVALLIAVVGVAGVLAFSVSARTREFGVRLAVGSAPRQLLARVLSEGTGIAAIGIAAGAAGGYALAWIAASSVDHLPLPGVLPVLGAAALLLAAAVIASLLPAARASRVDVVQALRSE